MKTMVRLIKKITRQLGFEVIRYSPNSTKKELVSLKLKNGFKGNVLLSYINGVSNGIDIFLLKDGESIPNSHTNYWESLQIAKTFLDLGYAVDVIDYSNKTFIPHKDYSFFIGARTNFERFAQILNKDCVKIVHLDTAHWLFNNCASYKRHLYLQQRKGVTITKSKKMVDKNIAIEYADYATLLGNQFTVSTYSYAKKPIYYIPISTCSVYPWPEEKDYEFCRKNFLWLGSGGLVHKGLDLVLDAFSDMPDYHLTICGPVKEEKEFESIYYKELYQLPNIHTVGWVDVSSQAFIDIMNSCIGLIYPSCSEGQSGCVVNCLHGGLIPIVSYESGVDVNGFGVILNDCSIDEIKNSIRKVSDLTSQELKLMAQKAWEFARTKHTRERFAEGYKKAVKEIMTNHDTKGNLNEESCLKEEIPKKVI